MTEEHDVDYRKFLKPDTRSAQEIANAERVARMEALSKKHEADEEAAGLFDHDPGGIQAAAEERQRFNKASSLVTSQSGRTEEQLRGPDLPKPIPD